MVAWYRRNRVRLLPHCPWMNGRIERVWSTFKQVLRICWIPDEVELQATLNMLRDVYGQRRAHQSLSGHTPDQAWRILIERKRKTKVTRSSATAIAGCDKVAEMIGQVPSAITLGFMAKYGEKSAISGLPRRRLDDRRVVKERVCGGEIWMFTAAARFGSGLADTDNTPNQAMGHEGEVQGQNAKPLWLQGSWIPQRAVVLVDLARLEGRRSALTRHCRVRT